MEAAELPPGGPAVPLASLAVGDVVTLQPLEEDGSISMARSRTLCSAPTSTRS